MKVTIQQLRKEVKRLDPNLSEEDEGFSAALVLLAAGNVGTSWRKIADFTCLDPHLVKLFVSRLQRNKVFTHGKINCEWFDRENGDISFWMDVCVAQGLMNRA